MTTKQVRFLILFLLVLPLVLARPLQLHNAKSTLSHASDLHRIEPSSPAFLPPWRTVSRGGSVEMEDGDENNDEESNGIQSTSAGDSVLSRVGDVLVGCVRSVARVAKAALTSTPNEESTLLDTLTHKLTSMWKALWGDVSDGEDSMTSKLKKSPAASSSKKSSKKKQKSKPSKSTVEPETVEDEVPMESSVSDASSIVLGGSLTDALKTARTRGRLLVVYLPSPSNKKDNAVAAKSFASPEVARISEKIAGSKTPSCRSFFLWTSKSTAESKAARKRLKLESHPNNVPVLLVASPVTRSVLAQHHCKPPPSAKTMAAWLNDLRKRHRAHYRKLQKLVQDREIDSERRQGYAESLVQEEQRRVEVQAAKEAAAAAAAAQAAHEKAIQARRAEFAEQLAAQTEVGENPKTIALRYETSSMQRRFSADDSVETLLNWVDVECKLEREQVQLTSLNGKVVLTFATHGEKTLEDVLGKPSSMAFRVSTIEVPKEDESGGKDGDNNEDDDEEEE